MKLAFCITELDPGGAERALVRIATGLAAHDHEVTVVSLTGQGELVGELQAAGIGVECVNARGRFDVTAIGRLTKLLRRIRPDIVQTFLFHANIAGRIAAHRAGVPIVCSGIRVAERRRNGYLWLDRRTERMVDLHVCVSEAVRKFSVEKGGLNEQKCVVIPNGVDFERFAHAEPTDLSEFGIPNGAPVVLFVGRLDPQKRPEWVIRAIEESDASCIAPAHVLFVGDGPLRRSLEEAAEKSAARGRIHLLGRRSDVPALMRAATVLALPSAWEGMPNVVLEAMASGLPVVATDADGLEELISGPELGFRSEINSEPRFRENLANAIGSPGLRPEIAVAAQHYVKSRFTWDSVVASYLDTYERLLSNTGGE